MFSFESFDTDGFAIAAPLLAPNEVAVLIELIEQNTTPDAKRGGVRDIVDVVPELRAVAEHPKVSAIVDHVLGPEAFPVRTTLFDKTGAANWKVPWHQDVTVAVSERREAADCSPWSVKAGVDHVQPPADVLQRMVTVRVHLDDCPASNGALRVMPGTHRLGKLNQNHVEQFVNEEFAVCCEVAAGSALVMRPLLLHASSAASNPKHRRVLHFDFATGELDDGLEWKMREVAQAAHQAE